MSLFCKVEKGNLKGEQVKNNCQVPAFAGTFTLGMNLWKFRSGNFYPVAIEAYLCARKSLCPYLSLKTMGLLGQS